MMRIFRATLLTLPIAAAVLARLFLVETCSVPSQSMAPALLPGDHLLVLRNATPQRGDVVVFRSAVGEQRFVKRIIALGNDEVEIRDGRVRVNGRTVPEPYLANRAAGEFLALQRVPANSYYVLGDNRTDSIDSRTWGTISAKQIVGRVPLIFWSSHGGSTDDQAHAAVRTADVLGRSHRGVRWRRVMRVVK